MTDRNVETPREQPSEDGRFHIESRFTRESLVDKKVMSDARVEREYLRMFPKMNVVKVGGQSIFDRGAAAVFPLMDEFASIMDARAHQLLIGVGGGTRSRHVYEIGLELGLPTGLLAILGGAASEQNSTLVQSLLAKHGSVRLAKERLEDIPVLLATGCVPILIGMPPYHYWEHPPDVGDLPPHRTDTGIYLLAEAFGARSMIFVKDEDGLYSADPKKDKSAEFISEISVSELRERDLEDLILERACVGLINRARHAKVVQIVNGLVPGRLTAALEGQHVGTVIYQDGVDWRSELIK